MATPDTILSTDCNNVTLNVGDVEIGAVEIKDADSDVRAQVDAAGNLMVSLGTEIAGEDVANDVLGVIAKPVADAAYSPNSFRNIAAATAYSLKAAPGSILSLRATNANAAVRYLQIHNKASAPLAGEACVDEFLIPAGTATAPGSVQLDSAWFADQAFLSVGVALAISTTAGTYTAATNADHTVNARYI